MYKRREKYGCMVPKEVLVLTAGVDTQDNRFEIEVVGTKDFLDAQVTSGGICLNEINLNTMESKLVKNLYFAGEVLDLDGDCGGYNLTIAFITGMLAGEK